MRPRIRSGSGSGEGGEPGLDEGGARQVSWLAVGTAVSRVTGFVRTAVLAAALGLYTVGSAFTVANTVPTVLYTLLVGGAVSAVFVPQLVRALDRGNADGWAYADRLLTVVLVVLAPLTLLAVLAAPLIARVYAGSGWTPADLALATAFTAWCLPQILFYAIFAVLGQLLQARGRPGPMTWAPIANNVVATAVGVVFLVAGGVDTGAGPQASSSLSATEIALLGGGATAGVVTQALILVPALRAIGYRYRPRLDLRGSGLGRSARLATWTLVFVAANQVAYSITVVVANTAGKAAETSVGWAAGLPTYTNAYMIMLVPHAIVAVSLANARQRAMSQAAVRDRPGEVGDIAGASLRAAGQLLVPAAAAIAAFAPLVTRLLFPGTPEPDARYMGLVLACFAPAIVIYSAQFLVVRALYALEDTRGPALVQLLITGLQVVLAVLAQLTLPPGWVVAGLAGGFALAYTAGLAVSLAALRRRTGRSVLRADATAHMRRLAAGAAAAAAGALVADVVSDLWGSGLALTALALACGLIVLAATYIALTPLGRHGPPRQKVR